MINNFHNLTELYGEKYINVVFFLVFLAVLLVKEQILPIIAKLILRKTSKQLTQV